MGEVLEVQLGTDEVRGGIYGCWWRLCWVGNVGGLFYCLVSVTGTGME